MQRFSSCFCCLLNLDINDASLKLWDSNVRLPRRQCSSAMTYKILIRRKTKNRRILWIERYSSSEIEGALQFLNLFSQLHSSRFDKDGCYAIILPWSYHRRYDSDMIMVWPPCFSKFMSISWYDHVFHVFHELFTYNSDYRNVIM